MKLTARVAAVLATVGLALGLSMACGKDDKADEEETSTGDLSFTDDINPILIASCGASGCHGTTSPGSTVYVGKESVFKASSSKGQLTNNLMPKAPSTISAADEATLIKFLDQ